MSYKGPSHGAVGFAITACVQNRLYCIESPESWFEDFGTAPLECGRAEITLDPDFAAVSDSTDYHVFLTELEAHHGLSVIERRPTGFILEAGGVRASLKMLSHTDINSAFAGAP